jgi:hypothetical protein
MGAGDGLAPSQEALAPQLKETLPYAGGPHV